MRPTMANLRKLVARLGGTIESDGCGGWDILAPPDRRWIDAEVQGYVLPLGEYEPEERPDLIRECIDMIENGHEPFPDEPPYDPAKVDEIVDRINREV